MNVASVSRNSGSFHLGFDNELVARFPDRALRRQLLRGESDRLAFPTTASREAFYLADRDLALAIVVELGAF